MTEPVPIDPEWCQAVVAVFKAQTPGTVKWDPRGQERFQNDYAPRWPYEAVDAMAGYLESPIAVGFQVDLPFAKGTTWEFLFPFNGRSAYGKLTLTLDGKKIMIWSAHLPTGDRL